MSGEDLAHLGTMLDAEGLGDTPEPDTPPAVDPDRLTGDQVAMMAAGLVAIIGNRLCQRASVTELTKDEITMLAGSVGTVADQYDLHMSGKAGAWYGLGATVLVVVSQREKIEPVRDRPGGDETDPTEPIPPADPKVPGSSAEYAMGSGFVIDQDKLAEAKSDAA